MDQELRQRKLPKGDSDKIHDSNNEKKHTHGNFNY